MTRFGRRSEGIDSLQSVLATANIGSPAFKANSHSFYARLRTEAPVCRVPLPGKQFAWLVTRYDDVAALLKDNRFIKERWRVFSAEQAARQPWVPETFKPLERNMLDLDPPDHTRLRALVHKAFTPRLVENLRGRIESLTNELLTAVERKRTHGPDPATMLCLCPPQSSRKCSACRSRTGIGSTAGQTRS